MNKNLMGSMVKVAELAVEITKIGATEAFNEIPKGFHNELTAILLDRGHSPNPVEKTIAKFAQYGLSMVSLDHAKGLVNKLESAAEPDNRPNEKRELGKPPEEAFPKFIVKSFQSEAEMNDFIENQMKGFLKDTFGIEI